MSLTLKERGVDLSCTFLQGYFSMGHEVPNFLAFHFILLSFFHYELSENQFFGFSLKPYQEAPLYQG